MYYFYFQHIKQNLQKSLYSLMQMRRGDADAFALIYAESKIVISASITPLPLGYLKIRNRFPDFLFIYTYYPNPLSYSQR